jgi:hypothetical protein
VGSDNQILNAIAVEIRLHGQRARHEFAGRSKLLLDEIVIDRRGGRRSLLGQGHK